MLEVVGGPEEGDPGEVAAVLGRLGKRDLLRRRRRFGRGEGEVAGEVEVGEDEVAVGVDEDVLGLEVAVDDAEGVEVGEGHEDLGEVEADGALGEDAVGEGVAEGVEVAAGAEGDGVGEERGVLGGAH